MSEFLIPLLELTAILSFCCLLNGRAHIIPFLIGGALLLSLTAFILCRINNQKKSEQNISPESGKEPAWKESDKTEEEVSLNKAAEKNMILEKVDSFETFCMMSRSRKQYIKELDFSQVDFSQVTDTQNLLKDCINLNQVILSDSILKIHISQPTGNMIRKRVKRTQEEINSIYKDIYIHEGPDPLEHAYVNPYKDINVPEMKSVLFEELTETQQHQHLGISNPETVTFIIKPSFVKNHELKS